MSEYQYYDFRAVDKPLSDEEMDDLRALSSRAEITSSSFTNEYSYGNFRGKPADLMSKYFDALLSAPLKELADFLRVEDALIKAAAAASSGEAPAQPSREELARWLKKMPAATKEAYFSRFLAAEGDELLRAEMFQRYREATSPKNKRTAAAERQTVAQLLTARDALIEKRSRKTAKNGPK